MTPALFTLNRKIKNMMLFTQKLSLWVIVIITTSIFSWGSSSSAVASEVNKNCTILENKKDLANQELMMVEHNVQKLGDFKRLEASLPKNIRILFDSNFIESPVNMECVWQVFIYLDKPNLPNRSLWKVYPVTRSGIPQYVMSNDGNFVEIN